MSSKVDPIGRDISMVRVGSEDGSWYGQQVFRAKVTRYSPGASDIAILMHGAIDPISVRVFGTMGDVYTGITDANGALPVGKRWIVHLRGLQHAEAHAGDLGSRDVLGSKEAQYAQDDDARARDEADPEMTRWSMVELEKMTVAQLRCLIASRKMSVIGTNSRSKKSCLIGAILLAAQQPPRA